MELISVNRGAVQLLNTGKYSKKTGIFKQPVSGPVGIGVLGVEDDAVVNTKHHGGADQAVYIYTREDYDFWVEEHGIDASPGLFGENLTIAGFESADRRVGDRLSIGSVVLEITAPRIPCSVFAAKMGDPGFVKRFRKARRPGLYARVIAEGELEAGDAVALTPSRFDGPDLGAQFDLYFESAPSPDMVAALLAMPIAERERDHYARFSPAGTD